ncbi:MAG: L-seryl-tRNA(Sec) selenium transferase [Anaerolineae bacterium]|nr:L-seryl-tRNA(Sec) selenium transferase [Anaerolineae bacterium]
MNENDLSQRLRALPSVDALLSTDTGEVLAAEYGQAHAVEALRNTLDAAREAIRAGGTTPTADGLLAAAGELLRERAAPTLRPVINATGVIVHTNLGRAPLSEHAIAAMVDVARGYSTLEYDLTPGQRGKRDVHAERFICDVTGAPGGLVVNNNAAAVTLLLIALARGKEVLISRGQLVQIGGGFRVPEVVAQSGAQLVEVGMTNRTSLSDYAQAITANTAMILVAHTSNFKMIGFTEQPELRDLAALARERGLILANDLGSGALLDTARFGLAHEPTVQDALAAGCDLVSFSGDKLLGGPQAGLIVGRAELAQVLKRHPFARAVRMGKLDLAALVATLASYRRESALDDIPIWRMIAAPVEAVKRRAQSWRRRIGAGTVIPGESTVGGGSLPGETLPTALLALAVASPDSFAAALRAEPTPVIARIAGDRVLLDPRTVLPEQERALIASVKGLLAQEAG